MKRTAASTPGDGRWMRRALKLGRKYVGQTAPNPAVGCVLVKNGRVVGEGAHRKAGTAHAEVIALGVAGKQAKGATVYVTLEPCCHHGKTPPCTDALITAGVKRIVVGAIDPNPKVAGKGIAALRRAGITVDVGILIDECEDLIADFRVWTLKKRPYVIYKVASTLDGATAIPGQGNWQITGEASRRRVHRLRAGVDAVVVGAGTWRLDDPDLRPRLAKTGKKPLRVVVASKLPAPTGKLASIEPESVVWICGHASAKHRKAWEKLSSRVIVLDSRPTPTSILAALGKLNVHRVLLEGGPSLAGSFLAAGAIDRMIVTYGAKIYGATPLRAQFSVPLLEAAQQIRDFHALSIRTVDTDIWLEGTFR